jgi:Uma2 family endonuclease
MEATAMAITQTYTAEEADALCHDRDFELIDGELSILPGSSGRSSGIAVQIAIEIGIYLKSNPIGRLTGEAGGFIISRGPDTLFCPDVGFIRRERLVDGKLPDSFLEVHPTSPWKCIRSTTVSLKMNARFSATSPQARR